MGDEKSCGCIVTSGNEVLVVGARDDTGEIFWGFPKGHQKPSETDVDTALRETREETGLEVEITDTAPILVSHPIHGGAGVKRIYLFLAKVVEGSTAGQTDGEIEEMRWPPFSEVEKYLSNYYLEAWQKAAERLS